MIASPTDADTAQPVTWWPIETITIATARLCSINEKLARLCAEMFDRREDEMSSSGVEIATAANVFGDHAARWAAVRPESVRLQRQRALRPMPTLVDELRDGDPPDFEPLISALYEATKQLALGVDNPEGRPFARVCEAVLGDLQTLSDTASASRTGTFVDKLSVFTLEKRPA